METWPLPEGWEWKQLGSVVVKTEKRDPRDQPDKQFTYIEISSVDNENGKIVDPRHLPGKEAPSRARCVVRTNDVIFATTRPYLRNIALIPSEYDQEICTTGFCVLRADRKQVEPKWLFYLARSNVVMRQIEPLMHGATYPAVTNSETLSVEIPIPPLATQRRIVARIEELFAELGAARHLHAALVHDAERLMQCSLVDVLESQLSSYPANTIGDLKKSKQMMIYGGGTPSKKKVEFWNGNIPWASPKDIKTWLLFDTQDHITQSAIENSSAKLIPSKSVLVVVRGMILDRTWPVAVSQCDMAINQDMKALAPNDGLLPEYLGYVLRVLEPFVLPKIETAAHGTKRFKTQTLESLEIPIPPLSEQRRIVAYLDEVQTHATELQHAAAAVAADLDRLEQSILARAFEGAL